MNTNYGHFLREISIDPRGGDHLNATLGLTIILGIWFLIFIIGSYLWPEGSKRVFKLLGSKDKKYLSFDLNRHGILLGEGSHQIHRAIGDFIMSF